MKIQRVIGVSLLLFGVSCVLFYLTFFQIICALYREMPIESIPLWMCLFSVLGFAAGVGVDRIFPKSNTAPLFKESPTLVLFDIQSEVFVKEIENVMTRKAIDLFLSLCVAWMYLFELIFLVYRVALERLSGKM